jgi:hypothetical protein
MEKRINLNIIDSLKNENGELVIKYKEPKEGEYWYVNAGSSFEYVFIKKRGSFITNHFCSIYLEENAMYFLGYLMFDDGIKELRPATEEERNLLDNKLREQGKFFNQETKQIEEIKEEIKVGDFVEFVKDTYAVIYIDRVEDVYELSNKNSDKAFIYTNKILKKINPPEPKVGDLCIFWNKDKSKAILSILERLLSCGEFIPVNYLSPFENAIPCYHLDQYRNFINGKK